MTPAPVIESNCVSQLQQFHRFCMTAETGMSSHKIQEQFGRGIKEIPQAVEQRVGIPITAAHAAPSPPMQESVPVIEHVTPALVVTFNPVI